MSSSSGAELPAPQPAQAAGESNEQLFVSRQVSRDSLSLAEGATYVSSRALPWTIVSGLYGTTTAYLQGVGMALPFYTFGGTAMVATTGFFAGAYASKYIRERDDVYNFAISGAVNGAVSVSIFSGVKKGGIAGLVGASLGAMYGVSSVWLYYHAKQAWIDYRLEQMQTSKERKLIVGRPSFPKSREEYHLARRERMDAMKQAAQSNPDQSTTSTTTSTDPVQTKK